MPIYCITAHIIPHYLTDLSKVCLDNILQPTTIFTMLTSISNDARPNAIVGYNISVISCICAVHNPFNYSKVFPCDCGTNMDQN